MRRTTPASTSAPRRSPPCGTRRTRPTTAPSPTSKSSGLPVWRSNASRSGFIIVTCPLDAIVPMGMSFAPRPIGPYLGPRLHGGNTARRPDSRLDRTLNRRSCLAVGDLRARAVRPSPPARWSAPRTTRRVVPSPRAAPTRRPRTPLPARRHDRQREATPGCESRTQRPHQHAIPPRGSDAGTVRDRTRAASRHRTRTCLP